MIVLGGLGALVLLSNLGAMRLTFGGDEDSAEHALDAKGDAIEAKVARIEAAIERRLEAATERLDDAESDAAIDDDELDSAIEDLRDGNPERFLKALKTL